jgi:hypothetical protein
VFSGPLDSLWWLGRDGSSLVAAGESFRYERSGVQAGEQVAQRPLLLRSSDGGATWTVSRPAIPARDWEFAEQLSFSGRDAEILALPRPVVAKRDCRRELASGSGLMPHTRYCGDVS